MYNKLNVPIIGIVENMSSVTCPSCSSNVKLFGNDVLELSNEFNIDLMARFPLEQEVSDSSDKGVPIVIGNPTSAHSGLYRELASKVFKFLLK